MKGWIIFFTIIALMGILTGYAFFLSAQYDKDPKNHGSYTGTLLSIHYKTTGFGDVVATELNMDNNQTYTQEGYYQYALGKKYSLTFIISQDPVFPSRILTINECAQKDAEK